MAAELERPAEADRPPPGYSRSADDVIAAAERSPRVRAELRSRPSLAPVGYTRGNGRWQVSWFQGRREVVQAQSDDRTGRVLEVWTGFQVSWEMARGYDGAFGRSVTAPYVWIPFCLLFVAPFVDPRRPFRLLHLDLLVLLGFSVSHVFFNRGEIFASVPLVYPVLAYLLVRTLLAGVRPRARSGPLLPVVPVSALALALVFLVGFRVALNLTDSNVIDVGYAGVIGADLIGDGKPVYEGDFPRDNRHGDTYGPVAYLAYVPFEQVLPRGSRWDDLPAAHAAALAFDLGTMAGLFLVGRRMRAGPRGRELGLALAYGWASYPYALYALESNSNDGLVALLAVAALLALSSPAGRGALVALGGMAKFASLALAPLFAAGTGERRLRSLLPFTAAFLAVGVAVTVPLLPDGGVRELLDRTLLGQITRESPFSLWGQYPGLEWAQRAVAGAGVALGVAVAFVPRRRTPAQVAALGAAVVILVQAAATHWFYLYVVWFFPLLLVALLSEQGHQPRPEAGAARERPDARLATPAAG